MLTLLIIALRNLLQARRRTSLLSLALSSVTLLLVLLMSLSNGLSDTMMDLALTFAAGHINVAGFFKAKAGDASPILVNAPPIRKILEEETPNLDYVIDRHRGYARLSSERASIQAALLGVDPKQEARLFAALRLAEEREYKDGGGHETHGSLDRLSDPRAIVLFASQAKKLSVLVGDRLTMSNETFAGTRNAADVTIGAIVKDVGLVGSLNAIVSRQLILDLYKVRPESTGAEMVYLKDPEKIEETLVSLRQSLQKHGFEVMEYDPEPFFLKFENVASEDWFGQKLDLTRWNDEVVFLAWILTAVNAGAFALVFILTLIIAVGVMNSMWIAVRERTQEIGTLRAIGMGKYKVLGLFLTEAMLLGFGSSVAGAVVGFLLVAIVDHAHLGIPFEGLRPFMMSDVLHLSIGGGALFLIVLVFTLVTALAALWPALRAARLAPIVAMQRVS
ncbi:MAG: FtsX-like permease family protein [Myxococcota bacterium]